MGRTSQKVVWTTMATSADEFTFLRAADRVAIRRDGLKRDASGRVYLWEAGGVDPQGMLPERPEDA